jgi:hypothetical protein
MMEAIMTETNITTNKTQLTPAEAATALASLLPAYDTALARKEVAERALDKAAVEEASTELAQIRTRVRELMQTVAPGVELSDS